MRSVSGAISAAGRFISSIRPTATASISTSWPRDSEVDPETRDSRLGGSLALPHTLLELKPGLFPQPVQWKQNPGGGFHRLDQGLLGANRPRLFPKGNPEA